MQYIKDNKIYTFGQPGIFRTDSGGLFLGVPTAKQLAEWGFTLIPEHQLTQEELLEQARARKLAELEAYDSSNSVNSFTLNGVPMWLDYATRQQLRTSIEAYQAQDAEQVTKWFNGVQFTFPTATWLYMLNLLEVYASDALNVTESHRAAINSLGSIEDIDEYDFTVGYPNKVEL